MKFKFFSIPKFFKPKGNERCPKPEVNERCPLGVADSELRVPHRPESLTLSIPTLSLASPPGAMEKALYYTGLPSCPLLVARSSTFLWEEPQGLEACPKQKYITTVGAHQIRGLMNKLDMQIIKILDSQSVRWTSIDVLRIGYEGEAHPPVILWIGVEPSSLSGDDGVRVALACKTVLVNHGICDVDCELRESGQQNAKDPGCLPVDPDGGSG